MPYVEHQLRVRRTARWGSIGELSPATRDLWFVLHGYAQLASGIARGARWPESPDRAFVFPEALQRFYAANPAQPQANRTARVVASWMTRDARDADIADNHEYLDALLETVRASAPQARLTVLGFSQGGATSARWCATLAERRSPPARLILWGSALPEDLDLGPTAAFRTIPMTLVFGTRDRWVPSERVSAERSRVAAAGLLPDVRQFEGGHRLDDALLSTLAAEGPATQLRTLP